MQVVKSKFNATGWWGLVFFVLPLPALAGIYALVADSNDSQINIATTIGRDTSSLKLMEVSPWVIVVMGAIMLLGVVMMVIGRVSYVQELAR